MPDESLSGRPKTAPHAECAEADLVVLRSHRVLRVRSWIECRGYTGLHDRWDLPGPRHWSRWEGRDRGRRSIEIDIVADLDDRTMLTGEVKWSSREVDHDLHLHLVRDLEDLARSGMAWAKRALSSRGYYLYVSAAGFTDHFRQRAAEHGRVRLVALDDLY